MVVEELLDVEVLVEVVVLSVELELWVDDEVEVEVLVLVEEVVVEKLVVVVDELLVVVVVVVTPPREPSFMPSRPSSVMTPLIRISLLGRIIRERPSYQTWQFRKMTSVPDRSRTDTHRRGWWACSPHR